VNDLILAELPPNVKILLHFSAAPSIEDVITGEDSDAMMFYSTDCPFKSERTFTVKISCKHPTFGICIDMDELFHKPWIRDVSKSKKTSIYSSLSSTKTVGRNLQGAYIVAINDIVIFPEANVVDAFSTVQKSKDKTFKLIIGYLDKISAQEAQHEQDDLLLHLEKYSFSAEPEEELVDDDNVPSPSTSPTAPSPSHEHNVGVPTPGIH
jgi:hypothetical protein